MFRAVAVLSFVPRLLPPPPEEGTGDEAIATTCFWDTKECSEIFFVSSGTIFAGSQNPHKFVETVVGKLLNKFQLILSLAVHVARIFVL